jgi:hypothetical protein
VTGILYENIGRSQSIKIPSKRENGETIPQSSNNMFLMTRNLSQAFKMKRSS